MEQSRKPPSILKFMVHFTYGLNFMALLIKAAWLCGLEVFQRIQRNVLFSRWGSGLSPFKTGKKLSIFSKELMFVVVKTTFVFEKEEKEEEVLQKKNEKHNKIRSSGFFSCHTVLYIQNQFNQLI